MNESDIYREWHPPEAWLGVVACVWEQRIHADRIQRVLPDGHADVLLYGSGEVELVGIYDHVALPKLPRGTVIRGEKARTPPRVWRAPPRLPGCSRQSPPRLITACW